MSTTTLLIVPLPPVPAVVIGVGLILLLFFAVLSTFKEVSPGDRPTIAPSSLTLTI